MKGSASRPRRRAGSALLELLVALPLALLVSAVAVQLFTVQLRVTSRAESLIRNQRELAHAAMVLAADVRGASSTALETWSDTSVVLHVPVLVGVVCAAPAPHIVDVVSAGADHVLRAMANAAPRAGDRLYVSPADTMLAGDAVRALDSISNIATLRDATYNGSACNGSPLRAGTTQAPLRLELDMSLSASPDVGTLITVARRTEWRAYRAGDGEYYLGRREWNGTAWSVIQPVAGPLANTAQRGLRLLVARADGSPASPGVPDARIISAQLRMPRRPANAVPLFDSLHLQMALRGGR